MKIREIIHCIEELAPLSTQASYDNSGLIIGDAEDEVSRALICLDITDAVLDEAIQSHCDLIISHHPAIFQGVKKINPKHGIGQLIYKAIHHRIAIYAAHTNLDHAKTGVSALLADKLHLQHLSVLKPLDASLVKIAVFCPSSHAEQVRNALFDAGCGRIGQYDQCSFNTSGFGTFKASEQANPFVGKKGFLHREEELKIEVICPEWKTNQAIEAMKAIHPYEEPAYDVFVLKNVFPEAGSGMIGFLEKPMDETSFLPLLKQSLSLSVIRHSALRGKPVEKIAVCGGSGSFLISEAIKQKADVLVTGDVKYHDFFEGNQSLLIADIGHYESEILVKDLFIDVISKKMPKFALQISKAEQNPVFYF